MKKGAVLLCLLLLVPASSIAYAEIRPTGEIAIMPFWTNADDISGTMYLR